MNWFTRCCFAALFASALAVHTLTTFADTKKEGPDKPLPVLTEPIPGYYSVDGTQVTRDGESKAYSGVCMIDKAGEMYVCAWNVVGNSFVGVGLFRDGQLCVGWSGEDKARGAYSLKLLPDGSLDGRWVSMPGNGVVQRETLKLLRKMPTKRKDV